MHVLLNKTCLPYLYSCIEFFYQTNIYKENFNKHKQVHKILHKIDQLIASFSMLWCVGCVKSGNC